MSQHNSKNVIYFVNNLNETKQPSKSSLDDKILSKILQILAKQSMKERTPTLEELDKILQNSLMSNNQNEEKDNQNSKNYNEFEGTSTLIKILENMGYLTGSKKWLTSKGFFEIGKRILQDVMSNLNSSEYGLHEIKNSGNGSVTIDSTTKYEQGDDLKNLSVPQTLLNSIQRLSKSDKVTFPLSIDVDDFEKFETHEEVKASIVYCIDLSSTMKYSLGKEGLTRIEAAKRALWCLYVLNKKFFPNDSIFIIGFASMASIVKPFDIPFLKTFDANDNFLHYTNYQAALRLSRKILKKIYAQNKRIVLITDGQPSACFIENEHQKNEIISEKPYSNFYSPEESLLNKVNQEKDMKLVSDPNNLVYLCYRYKKIDQKIHHRTIVEAKKCKKENIDIDTIVVSDEIELLDYIKDFEKELKGRTYHINDTNIDEVLVVDYLKHTKKVLSTTQAI